ncbi:unnamed protein product [Caenorhabditis auriculariae]|uniref:Uncharacterized protein n=1 Tax=Caenorhabditis auriculariae TaxID=2777116 RepID=A0A8S1HUE3_9PELO|nr:unnamed protein product [Caenorhabditis auriculariae]
MGITMSAEKTSQEKRREQQADHQQEVEQQRCEDQVEPLPQQQEQVEQLMEQEPTPMSQKSPIVVEDLVFNIKKRKPLKRRLFAEQNQEESDSKRALVDPEQGLVDPEPPRVEDFLYDSDSDTYSDSFNNGSDRTISTGYPNQSEMSRLEESGWELDSYHEGEDAVIVQVMDGFGNYQDMPNSRQPYAMPEREPQQPQVREERPESPALEDDPYYQMAYGAQYQQEQHVEIVDREEDVDVVHPEPEVEVVDQEVDVVGLEENEQEPEVDVAHEEENQQEPEMNIVGLEENQQEPVAEMIEAEPEVVEQEQDQPDLDHQEEIELPEPEQGDLPQLEEQVDLPEPLQQQEAQPQQLSGMQPGIYFVFPEQLVVPYFIQPQQFAEHLQQQYNEQQQQIFEHHRQLYLQLQLQQQGEQEEMVVGPQEVQQEQELEPLLAPQLVDDQEEEPQQQNPEPQPAFQFVNPQVEEPQQGPEPQLVDVQEVQQQQVEAQDEDVMAQQRHQEEPEPRYNEQAADAESEQEVARGSPQVGNWFGIQGEPRRLNTDHEGDYFPRKRSYMLPDICPPKSEDEKKDARILLDPRKDLIPAGWPRECREDESDDEDEDEIKEEEMDDEEEQENMENGEDAVVPQQNGVKVEVVPIPVKQEEGVHGNAPENVAPAAFRLKHPSEIKQEVEDVEEMPEEAVQEPENEENLQQEEAAPVEGMEQEAVEIAGNDEGGAENPQQNVPELDMEEVMRLARTQMNLLMESERRRQLEFQEALNRLAPRPEPVLPQVPNFMAGLNFNPQPAHHVNNADPFSWYDGTNPIHREALKRYVVMVDQFLAQAPFHLRNPLQLPQFPLDFTHVVAFIEGQNSVFDALGRPQ